MADLAQRIVLEVHERVVGRHLRREHLVRRQPPGLGGLAATQLQTAGPLVLALGDGAPRGERLGAGHLLLAHLLPARGDLELGHSLDLGVRVLPLGNLLAHHRGRGEGQRRGRGHG